MRKCPTCNQYGETDTTRFCSSCGTELFFPERFGEKNCDAKKNIFKQFFLIMKNIFNEERKLK